VFAALRVRQALLCSRKHQAGGATSVLSRVAEAAQSGVALECGLLPLHYDLVDGVQLRLILEGTMTETSVAGVPDVSDEAFSRAVVSIACGIYLIGYAGYSFDTLGPLRYLVYAVPPVLFASLLLQRASMSNKPALAFFLAYLVLASISYLIGTKDAEFFLRNFIIIALIILCFIPVIDVSAAQIRFVFLCSLIYLFLAYWLAEGASIRLLQILESGTGSAYDAGYDNHQGGLVGPVYAVFFYAIGAKLQFLLALVMSLLGGKRVGVVAILLGLVAAALFRNLTALKQRRNRFVALLGALAIINTVASNLISITEYGYRSLRVSVSIEEVMLGRHAIGIEMNRAMNNRPFVESLFGSGPGSGDDLASIVSDGILTQPHNDWLKILYEYGIVGSSIITTFMALVFSTSATGAVIAITAATMMSTDNILIYLYYQFPIVLMVAYSALQESAARKTPRRPRT
jgi:O-antigen ligase